MLVTDAKQAQKIRILDQVPYICYPVQLQKFNDKDVLALLDSKSKINTMTPAHMAQLALKVWITAISAEKINKSLLKTYRMSIAAFKIFNKLGCS